jgi:RNA polymerase primary sigma factor
MAKKKARKTARKTAKKTVKETAKKSVKKNVKKTKAKTKRKAKSPGLGQRLSGAYRAVVDTVTGTGALRNKLETPGTSESE